MKNYAKCNLCGKVISTMGISGHNRFAHKEKKPTYTPINKPKKSKGPGRPPKSKKKKTENLKSKNRYINLPVMIRLDLQNFTFDLELS